MADIKLDYTGQTGDLDIESKNVTLVQGIEAIDQQLRIRLRFFLEEWFLDSRLGIPYFRNILVKNPNTDLIRSVFRDAIDGTPGVQTVQELEASIEPASRTLTLSFRAILDTGEELNYSPFIIEL